MKTRAGFRAMLEEDACPDVADNGMASEQPRFRPVAIDGPIQLTGAIYALRMIQGAKLHTKSAVYEFR